MMDERVEGLGIMILDMDAFKNINDLYDRSFGDEVLRLTGRKIAAVLPENAGIYRLDGDEFGIIVLGGDEEQCSDLYNRIQYQFCAAAGVWRAEILLHRERRAGLLSQGWGQLSGAAQVCQLFSGTQQGAGQEPVHRVFQEHFVGKERRLKMAELLRESIDRGFAGFFRLLPAPGSGNFRPPLRGGGAGALALLEFGDVSPVEFIPILEQTGLIGRLGEWVFRSAARQCSLWRRFDPDFTVSVNLSYVELMERDIFPVVMGALRSSVCPRPM